MIVFVCMYVCVCVYIYVCISAFSVYIFRNGFAGSESENLRFFIHIAKLFSRRIPSYFLLAISEGPFFCTLIG